MNNQYVGMTVNERLYLSGLMDEFDIAVAKKDRERVIVILKMIELTDASIEPILERLGLK